LHEVDLLSVVIVVVLVSSILSDELLLFLLESVPGLRSKLNLLVGVETREEKDTEEIEGAGRRRFVFPLFDLEALLSIVSVDSFSDFFFNFIGFPGLIRLLSPFCNFNHSPLEMVALDVVVDIRLGFKG